MRAIRLSDHSANVLIELAETPEIVEPEEAEEGEGFAGVGDISDRLEDISRTISAVCAEIFDSVFSTLSDKKPQEFQIEFGVTLAGKAGIPLVTQGSAEAALKVTAKWT